MSMNTENVTLLSSDNFRMKVKDVRKAMRKFEEDLPEGSVIGELMQEIKKQEKKIDDELPGDTELPIIRFDWSGEGSGHAYDEVLLEGIAPLFLGTADVLFCWESGEFTGLRFIDGRVERRKVVQTLGDLEA